MNILLSIVAQIAHSGAILVAAPVLTGLVVTLSDRLSGRTPSPILRPWREVASLFGQQAVRTEGTSTLTHIAPLLSAIAAALLVSLIPSFMRGMVSAPLADAIAIAALFAFSRILAILAAIDAGTGEGAVAAAMGVRLSMAAEPALLLGIFTLALLAGSSNLDAILTARQSGLLPTTAATGLAIAALALLGWADRQRPPLDTIFSGGDLALLRIAEQWRLLAWCDLIGALALPFGLASANAGLLSWGTGLLTWSIRLLLAVVVLAATRSGGAGERVRPILALALALCGVATVLALIGGDPS